MFFLSSSRRASVSSACSNSTNGETSAATSTTTTTSSNAPRQHRRQSSACSSERSCGGLSTEETEDLWHCMLELQERYGCYNSRRIDLAMGAGDQAVNLMPNRFIIDTLNESLVDLPQPGREMLDRCLRHEANKPRHRLWKRQ